MDKVLGVIFGLLFLAIAIVVCGDVVPERHKTWGTVFAVAIGIPITLLILAGVTGIVLG